MLESNMDLTKVFSGVYFHTELHYPIKITNYSPDFVRQMALEILNHMPCDALQICTDSRQSGQSHNGSDVYTKTSIVSDSEFQTLVMFSDQN
ncbi:hypothetical protein TNCT_492771 [Trichonephila clavata]|uniref:Uncharacterized protein n=1 Tax=Trichonephila clavata TaxID=2740835 RepID=A0A8X6GBM7_TRICU|nr:hypothetical protein TNCT_492771 [Trichonephila clavata]